MPKVFKKWLLKLHEITTHSFWTSNCSYKSRSNNQNMCQLQSTKLMAHITVLISYFDTSDNKSHVISLHVPMSRISKILVERLEIYYIRSKIIWRNIYSSY